MKSKTKSPLKKKLILGSLLLVLLGTILVQSGSFEDLQGRFGARVYTRAEIIKLLVVDTGTPIVTSTTKCTFTDITGTEWYADYFYSACEEGWLKFPTAGAIDPNGTYTRAETSKLAYLAYGITESLPSSPSYTDVPSSAWYYSYIESLNAAGAFKKTSGLFGPDASADKAMMDYMTVHL